MSGIFSSHGKRKTQDMTMTTVPSVTTLRLRPSNSGSDVSAPAKSPTLYSLHDKKRILRKSQEWNVPGVIHQKLEILDLCVPCFYRANLLSVSRRKRDLYATKTIQSLDFRSIFIWKKTL